MPEGTQLWANWHAYDPDTPADAAFEVALYSDAYLAGQSHVWHSTALASLCPDRAHLTVSVNMALSCLVLRSAPNTSPLYSRS